MTSDEIVASILSALGPAEFIGTLTTGLLAGVVIPFPIRPGARVYDVVWGIALTGVLFFISRGLALYAVESRLWPRNVGFAVIWVCFCIALGVGLRIRVRKETKP